jgi:hypothetical protein
MQFDAVTYVTDQGLVEALLERIESYELKMGIP